MSIKKHLELVKPDYFYKRLPYRLYRKDVGSGRFYYHIKGGQIEHLISITNLVDKLLPKGIEFFKWVAKNGENSEAIRDAAAAYGTAYHVCCAMMIKDKGFDFDWLSRRNGKLTNFEHLLGEHSHMGPAWIDGFKKGLACFFQFMAERVIEVYALEMPVKSVLGYAATLDLVCKMKFGRQEVIGTVDLKSMIIVPGSNKKKEFHTGHEFQLEGQKFAWNENFPDLPITHCFNFAPVNFKGDVPTYELKDQSNTRFAQSVITEHGPINLFVNYVQIGKAMGYMNKPTSKLAFVHGKFEGVFDCSKHIINYTL